MPSTLLGPEEAAAIAGVNSANALIMPLPAGLIPSGGCVIRAFGTGLGSRGADAPGEPGFRPYLENCIVNASI
jgi:hypothetical protein